MPISYNLKQESAEILLTVRGKGAIVTSCACVCVATLFFFTKEVDNFPRLSILLPSVCLLLKLVIQE